MKRSLLAGAVLGLMAMAIAGPPVKAQPGPAVTMRGPNAILHVVSDLNRSATFYRDMVGLQPDSAQAFPSGRSPELARLMNTTGADTRTATFKVPGSETRIVLLNFASGGTAAIRPRLQDFGQIKTVIRVRDIDAQFAKVQSGLTGVFTSGGAPVRPEGPQGVNRAVITKDPDGAPLEFVFQTVPPIADTVPATSNVVGGWASLVVQDLATTIPFYQHLGIQARSAGRQAAAGLLALQGLPDATTTMSTSAVVPGTMYSWFIYAYGGVERTPLNGRLSQPGVTAISVYVDNVRTMLATLTAGGAKVESTSGAPVTIDGVERVLVRDPSGLLIELVQQQGGA